MDMTKSIPNLTFREQMRGFPLWQMFILSCMRFAEPLALTSPFPYLYFMIRDFAIVENPSDIAKFSGYLAGSFALFEFLCCAQWGKLSDKLGRKPILLVGLGGTSISIIVFGFSKKFYLAMVARSIMGCFNGNIAALRTAIGEVASEKNHQAVAFSWYSLLWNVGAVIGPMIGGSKYLTRPNYEPNAAYVEDSIYKHFLNNHPYALSNIIIGLFCAFSFIMGWLFLEAPLVRFQNNRDIGLEVGDYILTKLGYEMPKRPWANQSRTVTETTPLVENVDEEILAYTSLNKYSTAVARRYSSEQLGPVISPEHSIISTNINHSFSRKIFTPPVIQTTIANFLSAFHYVIYTEFLPVLLAGSFMPKMLNFPLTISGGFGYDSNMIGNLLSITGLIAALGILIMFPWLDRHYKAITIFRISTIIIPIAYIGLPYLIFTKHDYDSRYPVWFTKTTLYVLCCLNYCSISVGFPNLLMLIHRTAPEKHRAFINGTSLSLNALARCVGPIGWGYLVTFCENHSIVELSWFILGVLALICCVQSLYMEEYDDDNSTVDR